MLENHMNGPTGSEFNTVLDLLQYRASDLSGSANHPAFTYLDDGEKVSHCLTFSDLDKRARMLAAHIQAQTVRGDRVLLVFPPCIDYIVSYFACVYAGVIAVPALPPANQKTLPRLQLMAQDAQPKLALTFHSIRERMLQWQDDKPDSPLAQLTCLAIDQLGDAPVDWVRPELNPEDIVFLQYTSGSTGAPKGVMVSHRNLLANVALSKTTYGIESSDVFVSWLPPHHDFGLIGAINFPVFVGCHCVQFPPAAFLMRPYRWLKLISDYRARMTGAPNFAFELAVAKVTPEQKATLDLRSLKVAVNGADRIRCDTLRDFASYFADCGFHPEAITPAYGLAESVLLVSANMDKTPGQLPVSLRVSKGALAQNRVELTDNEADSFETAATGKVVMGSHQVLIVAQDASQAPEVVDEDRVGEIWVQGMSVAGGYWGRAEESRATFGATLPDRHGTWLRTGDVGFVHGGQLFVVGRIKEMMIFKGRNVYPQDVEASIEVLDPAFRPSSCAAFAVEQNGQASLVIVQELESRKQADLEQIIGKVAVVLADEHEIFDFAALLLVKAGHLPRTSSGKIQRGRCQKLFQDNEFEPVWEWRHQAHVAEYIAPQGEVETALAEMWQGLLNVEKVGRLDHFFDLGGHSLAFTKLSFAIKERFGVELSIGQLYELQILQAMGERIVQLQQQAANRQMTTIVLDI